MATDLQQCWKEKPGYHYSGLGLNVSTLNDVASCSSFCVSLPQCGTIDIDLKTDPKCWVQKLTFPINVNDIYPLASATNYVLDRNCHNELLEQGQFSHLFTFCIWKLFDKMIFYFKLFKICNAGSLLRKCATPTRHSTQPHSMTLVPAWHIATHCLNVLLSTSIQKQLVNAGCRGGSLKPPRMLWNPRTLRRITSSINIVVISSLLLVGVK